VKPWVSNARTDWHPEGVQEMRISRRSGAETRVFTLGWVPSALQAEAQRVVLRCAGRGAQCPRVFTLGFVASALPAEARWTGLRRAARIAECSTVFALGWVAPARRAEEYNVVRAHRRRNGALGDR